MNAPASCKEIKIPLLCLQRNAHMGARAVKMLIKSNPLHSGGMSKEMGEGADGSGGEGGGGLGTKPAL